jgi:hypothetical protein
VVRPSLKDVGGLALILFLLFGFSGCTRENPTATPDGGVLYEEKCSLCHSLERPESKRMTYDEWHSTVLRMKNQNGAPITDQEAEVITEYLAATRGN